MPRSSSLPKSYRAEVRFENGRKWRPEAHWYRIAAEACARRIKRMSLSVRDIRVVADQREPTHRWDRVAGCAVLSPNSTLASPTEE
jgi:hypothetical protein